MNINNSIYSVQNNNLYSRYSSAGPADNEAARSKDPGKKMDSFEYSKVDEITEMQPDAEVSSELVEEQEAETEQEEASGDQSGSSGKVGINAGKLARMLAAAKTRAQVQAVIAKIQADLNECEAGKNNGMDVDEASVKAAQQLLQQAHSQMGSAENREATPEEEMAAALASLM